MARDEQIEHDSRKLSAKVEHHFPMMIFTLKWLNINQKYPNQLSTELFYEDWLPTVATSLDNANRSKQLFQITQLRRLLGWRRSTHEITKHKEGGCIHVVCIVIHRQCKYMCSCTHLKPSLHAEQSLV